MEIIVRAEDLADATEILIEALQDRDLKEELSEADNGDTIYTDWGYIEK